MTANSTEMANSKFDAFQNTLTGFATFIISILMMISLIQETENLLFWAILFALIVSTLTFLAVVLEFCSSQKERKTE